MKYLLLFFAIAVFSCNNSENASAPPKETNSREAMLKNDIARFPDSAVLKENLVQYYRDAGLYDNAIATVNDAIKKDTASSRWWDIKATLQFEDADTTGAIRSFENAIAINADPQYIIALGTLYAQTKNPNALVMADALLSSKAMAEKESYFIKGLYYSYMNEKERSIPYFDKCLQINYTYMSAYTEKALALYDLKKYTEALAVLDKGITLQNNYDEGYYYKGRVLEKLNRPQDAIDAYQTALMYDPDYAEAKDALAKLGVKN
jgi:tetratricopeptide (TPR) repeat protein